MAIYFIPCGSFSILSGSHGNIYNNYFKCKKGHLLKPSITVQFLFAFVHINYKNISRLEKKWLHVLNWLLSPHCQSIIYSFKSKELLFASFTKTTKKSMTACFELKVISLTPTILVKASSKLLNNLLPLNNTHSMVQLLLRQNYQVRRLTTPRS